MKFTLLSVTSKLNLIYFFETTYPNRCISVIPPEFNNKRFWFIDELNSHISKQRLSNKENEIDSGKNIKTEPA
jgi:hypothetical protein